jgi:hypothetical protein
VCKMESEKADLKAECETNAADCDSAQKLKNYMSIFTMVRAWEIETHFCDDIVWRKICQNRGILVR